MTHSSAEDITSRPERKSAHAMRVLGIFLVVFLGLQLLFFLCNVCAAALPKGPIIQHLEESQNSPLMNRVFEYDIKLMGTPITYDNNRFLESMAKQDSYDGDIVKSSILSSIEYTMPDGSSHMSYYRYWHGWQLPAFLCLTFGPITLFAGLIALIALCASTFFVNELRHYLGWLPSIAFFIVSFCATGILFNFMGDLLMALSIFVLLGCCAVILHLGRRRGQHALSSRRGGYDVALGCFVGGCLFCYLDFFTIPSFAIALAVFSSLVASRIMLSSLKKGVLLFFKFTLLFLLGFLGTWIAKWALAACYLGVSSVASEVISETSLWTNSLLTGQFDSRMYETNPRLFALVISFESVFMHDFLSNWNWAGVVSCLVTIVLVVVCLGRLIWIRVRKQSLAMCSGTWALLATSLFPPLYTLLAYHHVLWHLNIFGYKPWAFTLGCICCVALYVAMNRGVPKRRSARAGSEKA